MSRCDSLGRVIYQGGCIFPFLSSISGLKVHFNGMEPCVVLAPTGAAASGLLEYPTTNWQWAQVQSEDFFYFLPFHMLSWGRPMVKAQGNLPVWSFNDSLTTVVCQRTGLDSSHACGEHSTNLCTGVQGSGDLIFKWLQSSNSTYQFVVECWNFTKVKKRNLKKMGVSLSVFFLLVTQCCNIYIGKLS